jgi:hypothetical protein
MLSSRFALLATLACCLWLPGHAQAPGDIRLAIVIGNAAYAAPHALVNPVNDAKAMGATLRALGFQVVELTDASRAQMQAAIEQAQATLKGKQGIGMLYYAGHGLQLEWRNYMVPVDAQLASAAEVPAKTVNLGAVLEAFSTAGNRMNILVLDACRDNPFADAATAKGLSQLDAPPGTILAFATAPGNVAEDGRGAHGLYTSYLLQELVKPQTRIEDVFKRTRFAVRQASKGRQIPWEASSLEDDFMFNQGQVVAVPKPDNSARERAYAVERADWNRVRESGSADDIYGFLAKFPDGNYAEVAQSGLEVLQRSLIRPQAGPDGRVSIPFATSHRDGDRYEVVWSDGLTGLEAWRGAVEVRQKDADQFDIVSTQGPATHSLVTRTGFTIKDIYGSYDPPLPVIPGGEFKIGNRRSMRTQLTLASGRTVWLDFQSRVVGRETINTAMGPVQTFRLAASTLTQFGETTTTTVWYDPDWGLPVRIRLEHRYAGSRPPDIRVREVVARSRKS